MMITGAAPVCPTNLTYIRAALGCQVSGPHNNNRLSNTDFFFKLNMTTPLQLYEGYGQTECTAGCSMSLPGDWIAGKYYSKFF